LESDKDYLLMCTNSAGKQKLAAWTIGEPHSVSITVNGDSNEAAGKSGDGRRFAAKIEAGRCDLELTTFPEYLTFGNATVN
jgi:hypothetical protein